MRRQIPNIITLANLLGGCASIWCTFTTNLAAAAWFIGLAAVFDVLDGLIARLLGVSGPMGVELDSLADVVSFGVAPAFIAYNMMFSQHVRPAAVPAWLCFAALLMAAATAWRLARFNTDPSQKREFKGLPAPANALFWAALNLYWANKGIVPNAWVVLVFSLLMAFLLVCNLKMFSFKIRDWGLKASGFIYLYVVTAIVLCCLWGSLGIAIDVLLYPGFSVLHERFSKAGIPPASRPE